MAIVNNKNNSGGLGNSFKISLLASCLASVFTSYSAAANQVIWSENFDDPALDGKGAVHSTIDMSGVTKWSIDVSGAQLTASSDWFKVKSGKLEGRDLDGEAAWLSEVIDVSAATGINISVSASESGTHENTDYFDLAYSIDGGAFVVVTDWESKGSASHTLIDDFTSSVVTVDLNAASTLQVKVVMKNNAGSEYIRLDDVVVSHGAGGGDTGGGDTGGGDTGGGDTGGGDTGGGDTGGGDTGGGTTITNACFNCPDLTKIADATQFDAVQYYQTVSSAISAGESAAQIKEKLNTVISTNYNQLTYSQVWTALTQTDEDPLNTANVILLYKGTSLAKFSNGSGSQSSDPDNWNREHVWAKSHGFPSSSAFAYTDIHHLRPTDISVNSSRGNLDFDLSDSPLSEAPANRVDSDSFEPRDAVKGDVARMILYMDVRYQGLDGSTPDLEVVNRITSTGEAKLGKLCTLLTWHEQDPVDSFEQTRNARAYEFQGNRNPFIDHPEWANTVFDASSCDGSGGGDSGGGDTGGGDTGGGDTGGGDTGGGQTGSTLIISEYIEGSSSNKALEIFNPTGATVDLSGYQLKLYSNGGTAANTTYSMTGTLAANDVIVIGNGNAAEPLKSALDVISGVANFNGDDYVELLKDGAVVDGIGTFGIRTNWGKDVTFVRKASVIEGDSNPNDSFDASIEWNQEAKDDFSFIGAHTSDAGAGGGGTNPTTPTLGQCTDTAEFIHNIQGAGASSPMVDSEVTIEGIVSAVYPSLSGYFVQEEVADQDADINTSEGIFVYHAGASAYPVAGQTVRVIGTIKEHFGRTQLTTTTDFLDCGAGNVPEALAISLPTTAADSFEATEGMLVQSPVALNVTNTLELAKYGQFVVSNGRLFKPTNVFAPNSAAALDLASENARNQLIIDDAVNGSYPATVPFPTGGLSHNNTLRLGDAVVGLSGVMDYSFGAYRVLPNAALNVVANNARTAAPTLTGNGSLSVASFNVLNYFNGPSFPTSRGADSAVEFDRQSAKIVAAIAAVNADVVGLMEIENDGYGADSAIADLVAKVNALLGGQVYQYVVPTTPQLGSDAITVGFIYKPATVSLEGSAVSTSASPFDYGNRQPLAQTFKELATGESLTIAVNHFKSKGSCGSASGGNADQGDGQGCWNELRTQAATGLLSWLAGKPTGTSDDDVLVIGDLNAYAKEDPITTLTAQGYKDLVSSYEGLGAYTYAFAGEMGNLDHALANESLSSQVVDTAIWHINADEPVALDYNVEKKSATQQSDFYGADAYRASDHDPIIVSLSLTSSNVLVGDFDSDGDIDINDVRAFSNALRAGQTFSLEYDFNGDGVVNTLDVRAMMSSCTRSRCAA